MKVFRLFGGRSGGCPKISAFLCRQTDFVAAAARTGKIVNIKKAQFLSGLDMKIPREKAQESGAKEILAD